MEIDKEKQAKLVSLKFDRDNLQLEILSLREYLDYGNNDYFGVSRDMIMTQWYAMKAYHGALVQRIRLMGDLT